MNGIKLIRTVSDDPDFVALVHQLDAFLAVIDGSEHGFYAQYNKIDRINHVVVAYRNDQPVGCGAIKAFSEMAMEVKRMFTAPKYRGAGIAGAILQELERWALEMGYSKCILETGKRQLPAIRLYEHHGYGIISNYGQYAGVENSVCFEKLLS